MILKRFRKKFFVKAVDLAYGVGFDGGHRTRQAAEDAAELERRAYPNAHVEVVTREEKNARLRNEIS